MWFIFFKIAYVVILSLLTYYLFYITRKIIKEEKRITLGDMFYGLLWFVISAMPVFQLILVYLLFSCYKDKISDFVIWEGK